VLILQAGAAIPGAPRNKPRDWNTPRQDGSQSQARTTFNSPRADTAPRRGFMVPTFRPGSRTHRQATQQTTPQGRKMVVDAGPPTGVRGGKGKASA